MSYLTMEQLNQTGIIGALVANANAVPYNAFSGLLLATIWFIIALGSFYSMTRRYGKGDFWASMTVGGFVTSMIAGLLMIIPNFMPLRWLVITIILTILSFGILAGDKSDK